MADYIDAGKLNQPVQVLELRETAAPAYGSGCPPGGPGPPSRYSRKPTCFSKVGIGGQERRRDRAAAAPHPPPALRWGDTHLFLTSITPMGRNHLEVDAAVVRVETVRQMAERDTVVQILAGGLTEKYVRHGQEWPMSVNELGLVLVTPKAVTLPPGGLVEARGALWEILAPHELDEFKNEYEIGRTVDL